MNNIKTKYGITKSKILQYFYERKVTFYYLIVADRKGVKWFTNFTFDSVNDDSFQEISFKEFMLCYANRQLKYELHTGE